MEDHTVYWLKRDFRLADNPALTEALADRAGELSDYQSSNANLEQKRSLPATTTGGNETVSPVFILEDDFLSAPETSEFHVHAVGMAMNQLSDTLNAMGGEALILRGDAVALLEEMYRRQPFTRLVAHEEIGNARTYARDRAVHAWCAKKGVNFAEYRQTGVFRGKLDRNKRHRAWKKFMATPALSVPEGLERCQVPDTWKELPGRIEKIDRPDGYGFSWTEAQQEQVQAVSETDAGKTLRSFLYERGIAYRGGISSPLLAFTAGSRMSVHFAWGTTTGRAVYQAMDARREELKAAKEAGDQDAGKWLASLRAFASRLHWRDHFIQRLETEPDMEFRALNPAYVDLEYDNDPIHLEAWISGTTGFPMVDACIRCMRVTGFINFRMRAMLTSFACHNLHLSWKLINEPMARLYTDYEPGIHLSQLQMQAGVVGINTLRIYSPDKQIVDQDPEAIFIKRWIPELRSFTAREIQDHRREPLGEYPGQIIDRLEASREMRQRVYAVRQEPGYREIAERVYAKHGSRRAGPRKKGTTKKANATGRAKS